jgi:inorganic pyrophosphatase
MRLVFDVLVEIPRGSRKNYEVDHASGRIRLDRTLFTAATQSTWLTTTSRRRWARGP